MTDENTNLPTATFELGVATPSSRYRIYTKRGWESYIPAKDAPVSFAVQQRRENCLVYRDVSNEEYFAARPDAQVRILFRTGPAIDYFGNGYFTWRTITRGGGVMQGDVYDLWHLVRRFEKGTPMSRLTRALHHIALRDYCRIVQESADVPRQHP